MSSYDVKNVSYEEVFNVRNAYLRHPLENNYLMATKVIKLTGNILFKFGTNIGQGLGRILSCGARKPEHT